MKYFFFYTGHLTKSMEFFFEDSEEPHQRRRQMMLKKYPIIKSLFGPDFRTKYHVMIIIFLQLVACSVVNEMRWSHFWILTYLFSGTCNHYLALAIHECAHHLVFRRFFDNKVFSMIANLPLGIPVAISFKQYHLDHHRYQGMERDVDLPTMTEANFFRGKFGKLLFLLMNPFLYSIRPYFVSFKKPTKWEIINVMVQAIFDMLIVHVFGWRALLYLCMGTLLGTGLHPMAGHFISEHFVFQKEQETYSYYGPLNLLSLNVGFHVEHHDFPYIPGSRLPKLHDYAPEYYDQPHYGSWTKVLYDFIMDDSITLHSRIRRKQKKS